MTSHHDSHTTTDVKPEMIPDILTENGILLAIDNICRIAPVRKNRRDIFMQLYIQLYIDQAHTALDIFRFAELFFSFVLCQCFSQFSCSNKTSTIFCAQVGKL